MRMRFVYLAFLVFSLLFSSMVLATSHKRLSIGDIRKDFKRFEGKRVYAEGRLIYTGKWMLLADAKDCIHLIMKKGGEIPAGYVEISGVVDVKEGIPYIRVDSWMRVVKQSNNREEIVLKSGEKLKVILDEFATAGYTWHISRADSTYIRLFRTYSQRISPAGVLGGKDSRIFIFKAVKKGRTVLVLKEYRKWEGEKKSIREFLLFLKVI